MASETVDLINYPLPATLYMAVSHELHILHGANEGHKSQDLPQPLRRKHSTIGMPGNALSVRHSVDRTKVRSSGYGESRNPPYRMWYCGD